MELFIGNVHAAAGRRGRRRPPGRAAGLTLIEMLVSVGILSMMIMAFGTILSQSQRLVSGTQAKIRANAAATAIEQVIRSDLRRASQNGFLCISTRDGSPQLFLTAAGTTASITGGPAGTGSFIGYGLCSGEGNTQRSILWRSGWVLKGDPGGNYRDVWPQDLSEILKMTVSQISGIINQLNSQGYVPNSLPNPPENVQDIVRMWQYLSANCEDVTIEWTDGTSQPNEGPMNWYGRNHPSGIQQIEGGSSGDSYRALWTHHDQTNWPKAIRFRFALRDPALPEALQNVDYEIICCMAQ